MTAIHQTAYPRLKSNYTDQELRILFTPTIKEQKFVLKYSRGSSAQICLLTLLKVFQHLGYFVLWKAIPPLIPQWLNQCIGNLFEVTPVLNYDHSGTRWDHLKYIRRYINIKPVSKSTFICMQQAAKEGAKHKEYLADIINVMIEELVLHRFELPAFSRFDRITRQCRHQISQDYYKQIAQSLNKEQEIAIEELLLEEKDGISSWSRLKREPAQPTVKEIRKYTEHVEWLLDRKERVTINIKLPQTKQVQFYHQAYAATLTSIRKFPQIKRQALVSILVYRRAANSLDNLALMFIRQVQSLHTKGKKNLAKHKESQQEIWRNLIQEFVGVLNAYNLEGNAAQRICAIEQAIESDPHFLTQQCLQYLSLDTENYLWCLPEAYRYKRSILFAIITPLTFQIASANDGFEQALELLTKHKNTRNLQIDGTDLEVDWMTDRWKKLVLVKEKEGQYHRKYFELCVFTELARRLRSGDVYIPKSIDFEDYRKEFISWSAYEKQINAYQEQSGLNSQADVFIETLQTKIIKAAQTLHEGLPSNKYIRMEKGKAVLSNLPTKKPTSKAIEVDEYLKNNIQQIDILQLIATTEKWLNLFALFPTTTGQTPRGDDYPLRFVTTFICLWL